MRRLMHHLSCLVVVGVAGITTPALSAIIYESAESGPTGQTAGAGPLIDSDWYLCQNFEVTSTVRTGSIGGHFIEFGSGGEVFGAIIRLNGEFDFPTASDFGRQGDFIILKTRTFFHEHLLLFIG